MCMRMKVDRTGLLFVWAAATGVVLLLAAVGCTPDEQVGVSEKVSTQTVEPAVADPPQPRFTANPFCAACHAGFLDEPFAARHEKAGIGCERCHGESERHRSDENNLTPPELMFPPERINPTCMMCHPRQDIQRVSSHKSLLEGAATIFDTAAQSDPTQKQYCTDCHAKQHKMNLRTIHWNKATGELIRP
ncbi:MAG TPA: hypothetical protein ENN81_09745 [Phycisphaerales bacterium]|nr:hypothetical protein [Phycisphaerales bacterium]